MGILFLTVKQERCSYLLLWSAAWLLPPLRLMPKLMLTTATATDLATEDSATLVSDTPVLATVPVSAMEDMVTPVLATVTPPCPCPRCHRCPCRYRCCRRCPRCYRCCCPCRDCPQLRRSRIRRSRIRWSRTRWSRIRWSRTRWSRMRRSWLRCWSRLCWSWIQLRQEGGRGRAQG